MDIIQHSASALVVIDMQRALYSGPAKPHEGDAILERVKALIARARAGKTLVVFIQHCSPAGTPCETGSKGWELVDGIAPGDGELLIQKTRPSIFFGTPLEQHLRDARVGRLILAGMKTEYCIDTSCRAAADLGFRVVLAADAHTTMDSPALPAASIIAHHNATLGGPFAEIVASDRISFD
ncbi:cysteine hydrolase family protein [Azospirillum canadense]|uniref:cysteine hydrolase family protein n=1 Tax=Azospirillum canadense TaxID=403962 RepID=UPI0022280A34|nr:cysteine hydrolase family protein [Azospirillum canadense]MCW2238132.1 nicotinamidase-related amidase [Azospirillum canadense]